MKDNGPVHISVPLDEAMARAILARLADHGILLWQEAEDYYPPNEEIVAMLCGGSFWDYVGDPAAVKRLRLAQAQAEARARREDGPDPYDVPDTWDEYELGRS